MPKKSIGWVSKLDEKQMEALKVYVASWPFVRDFKGEFVLSEYSFCKGQHELHIEEEGLKYKTTMEALRTGMSTFLEGWRAAVKTYGLEKK